LLTSVSVLSLFCLSIRFCDNYVRTTKYRLWTFLPLVCSSLPHSFASPSSPTSFSPFSSALLSVFSSSCRICSISFERKPTSIS
jgi:hypothetical protein